MYTFGLASKHRHLSVGAVNVFSEDIVMGLGSFVLLGHTSVNDFLTSEIFATKCQTSKKKHSQLGNGKLLKYTDS